MSSYAAHEVSVLYGSRTALHQASFAVEPGSLTALVGPNGAGKSTLLKALSGDVRVAEGSVRIDDTDIRSLRPRALAARRAVLPQASTVSFPLTVFEVVRLGISEQVRRDRIGPTIAEALERVDLAGFGGRSYHRLSGGERQRVHLARVLSQVPDPKPGEPAPYLFLDEPTTGLDIKHQAMILELAREFARAGGGVLAVLHDLNLAAAYADRVAVVRDGLITAVGPPESVIDDAMVLETYDIAIAVSRTPAPGVPFVLPQNVRSARPGPADSSVARLEPRRRDRRTAANSPKVREG